MEIKFTASIVVAASALMRLQQGTLKVRLKGESEHTEIRAPRWAFVFPRKIRASKVKVFDRGQQGAKVTREVIFDGPNGEFARMELVGQRRFGPSSDVDNESNWAVAKMEFADLNEPQGHWRTLELDASQLTHIC